METSCDKNSPKMSSVDQKVFTIVIRLLFFRFRIFSQSIHGYGAPDIMKYN